MLVYFGGKQPPRTPSIGGPGTRVGPTFAELPRSPSATTHELTYQEDFLAYSVPQARPVLYVDGEMALADLQDRIRALAADPPENLLFLPSERLFQEAHPLNLHEPEDQAAIERALHALAAGGRAPEVVIFDNLSSLSGGVDENDNSALDKLLRWLVKLRHTGLAVLLVHHAGKSGAQRGASRREDLLDTSIELQPPDEDEEPHGGAHFYLTFAKTRGPRPQPDRLELKLAKYGEVIEWTWDVWRNESSADALLRAIYEIAPTKQKDLAEHLKITPGAVSQQMKKLRQRGYAEIEDGRPVLTVEGRLRLCSLYPELETKMLQQEELTLQQLHGDSPI